MGAVSIEYAGIIFDSIEDFSETCALPERFVEKRVAEGLSGEEIIKRWAERKEKLESIKYLGM